MVEGQSPSARHSTHAEEAVSQKGVGASQSASEVQPDRQELSTHFSPVAQSPSARHSTQTPEAVSHNGVGAEQSLSLSQMVWGTQISSMHCWPAGQSASVSHPRFLDFEEQPAATVRTRNTKQSLPLRFITCLLLDFFI
jgi:hypothetical protein